MVYSGAVAKSFLLQLLVVSITTFCCPVQALKGTLGIPLIRFEDAIINMYPYTRVHPYETQEIIINDILKHFREVSSASERRGKITDPQTHRWFGTAGFL